MARTLFLLILLALITLALIPNPQNPWDSEWEKVLPANSSGLSLFERGLALFNIHLPSEWIPFLCILGFLLIVSLVIKTKR